jgi:UDP-3-O-[3-hydroxymyristoyl] N-acetylglucosamine deacetylase
MILALSKEEKLRYQRTIGRVVSCEGIGLHSGELSRVRFVPAPVDTGIIFISHHDGHKVTIRAEASHVISTNFSTTLGKDGVIIKTVEHLMAAMAGLKIDNLYVEVEGPEIPILDGSAWPFVKLFQTARIIKQGKRQPYLKIEKPIVISEGERAIKINPSDHFAITYTMSFDHPLFPEQHYTYGDDEIKFIQEVSKARTYGFLKDVERLRAAGLIKGGSLQNAVVIGEQGVINEEGFRYPDELVRHKVLDLMGDLALLGKPLRAELDVHLAGHSLHTQMVSTILNNKDAWVLIEDIEESIPTLIPSRWAVAPRIS